MAKCLISSQVIKKTILEIPCSECAKETALSILGFFSFFEGRFISPFVFWLGVFALKLVEKEKESEIGMIIKGIQNIRN